MQRPQKSGFCEGVVDMDQYYTTGEFARMAHVTIRTIRYYDKKGLLKPSFINESGYRIKNANVNKLPISQLIYFIALIFTDLYFQ